MAEEVSVSLILNKSSCYYKYGYSYTTSIGKFLNDVTKIKL